MLVTFNPLQYHVMENAGIAGIRLVKAGEATTSVTVVFSTIDQEAVGEEGRGGEGRGGEGRGGEGRGGEGRGRVSGGGGGGEGGEILTLFVLSFSSTGLQSNSDRSDLCTHSSRAVCCRGDKR